MDDQNEVMVTSEQANEVLNTTDTTAPTQAQPTGKDIAKAIGVYAGLGLATSAGIVVGMRIADRFCDWVGGKVKNRKKKKTEESDSDDQSEKKVDTSPEGEKILADS